MLVREARVLIVDDDRNKTSDLVSMVTDLGGQAAWSISDFQVAVDVLTHPDFPQNIGNPNVVLLDGNLTKGSMHGSDGDKLFIAGRRDGRLHETGSRAPGVLAVSCSILNDSNVSLSTGATVSARSPGDWEQLIADHISEPQFIPQGTVRRELLEGFGLNGAIRIALGATSINRVAALRLSATGEAQDDTPLVSAISQSELDDITTPSELRVAIEGLIRQVPELGGEHDRSRRNVTATVLTDSGVMVLSRDERPNPYAGNGGQSMLGDCAFDLIPSAHAGDMPSEYWADLSLDPATLAFR
jgi:hypothetical protein